MRGDLDLLTTPTLTDALTGAMREEPTALIIDLSAVEFIASRGLEALLMAHQSAGKTSVKVVSNSAATTRSLDVSGLTDYLHVYDTVASALAAETQRLQETTNRREPLGRLPGRGFVAGNACHVPQPPRR